MPSRPYTRFSKQCQTPIDTYTRLCNDNIIQIGDWRLLEAENDKLLFQRKISDVWYTAASLTRTLSDAQVRTDTFLAVNDVNENP